MKVPHVAGEGAGASDHGRAAGSGPLALVANGASDAASLAGSRVPTARAVADSAIAGWNAIAEALVPLIGRSSVTVLYRRCLISVGVDRTWLPSVAAADLPDNDWTVLHAAMSRRTATEASEATKSLLLAFHTLLDSLIGPSLTEQLLHPVSALPSNGSAEQDTLP